MSTRLPIPGSDDNVWGDILNAYLEVSLSSSGTLNDNVVGTSQIQNNAVTNGQLDSVTQSALSKANSAIQSVNTKSGSAITLAASDINAVSTSQVGAANGIAPLGSDSAVPDANLPSRLSASGLTNLFKGPFIDVSRLPYSLTGDGSTDVTTTMQTALNAASAAGGGVVYVPAGTYVVTTIEVDTKVWLVGAGPGVTFLQRKAGATGNVAQTKNYATYATGLTTGTTATGAPYSFGFQGFTIDGNKANASGGGNGLAICGYEYVVDNVHIVKNPVDGFYTEWHGNGPDTGSTAAFVESKVVNVKSMSNGRHGFWNNGPHDSMWSFCTSGQNAASDTTGRGFLLQGNGGNYVHCHAFGLHDWAYDILGTSLLTNCIGEGAKTGQIWAEWNQIQIIGGAVYWAGQAGAVGVRVGKTGIAGAQDCVIVGLAGQQGGAGIALSPVFDFQNVGRNMHIDAIASSTASGLAYSGSLPTDAYVNIQAGGGTTGGVYQNPLSTGGGSSPTSPSIWTRPTSIKRVNIPRNETVNGASTLTSGTMFMAAIYLETGDSISTIGMCSGSTPLSGGTHQFFTLYDSSLNKLGVTNDDTSNTWAANSMKTLTLTSPVTISTGGIYYVGVVVVATTPPTITSRAGVAGIAAQTPYMAGTSSSGLSDPTTAPNTAGSLTSAGNMPYAQLG